ncbi:MAG: hypothetical protein IJ736_15330, partial [Firmicutes bacterium]|nr:hypothetical protein [Bacillota bacterium]
MVSSKTEREIGILNTGKSQRITWECRVKDGVDISKVGYKVTVTAENAKETSKSQKLDPNTINQISISYEVDQKNTDTERNITLKVKCDGAKKISYEIRDLNGDKIVSGTVSEKDKNIFTFTEKLEVGNDYKVYVTAECGANEITTSKYITVDGKVDESIFYEEFGESGYNVISNGKIERIKLKTLLVKGGETDSDEDGLTDSEEVDWGYIKKIGEKYIYPTLSEYLENYAESSLDAIDEIKENIKDRFYNIFILPIKSNPMRVDSDGDGLIDIIDEKPLKYDDITERNIFDKKEVYIYDYNTTYTLDFISKDNIGGSPNINFESKKFIFEWQADKEGYIIKPVIASNTV